MKILHYIQEKWGKSYEKMSFNVSHCLVIVSSFVALLTPSRLTSEEALLYTGYDCLASAIYYEARGEIRQAQRAVYELVMNRVFFYKKSICMVVEMKSQFSWYKQHKIKRMDEEMWKTLQAVNEHPTVLNDGKVLFMYSGKIPYWARNMECRKIGNLNFCKEKQK